MFLVALYKGVSTTIARLVALVRGKQPALQGILLIYVLLTNLYFKHLVLDNSDSIAASKDGCSSRSSEARQYNNTTTASITGSKDEHPANRVSFTLSIVQYQVRHNNSTKRLS